MRSFRIGRLILKFAVLLLGASLSAGAQTAHLHNSLILGGIGTFDEPTGVAVDGSENVYVTDIMTSLVSEIPAGCVTASCVKTLGGGFSSPYGVAVDGSGNVFVADYSNNAVKEIPSGCATASCVKTLGGGFSEPLGVAVDGSENVFVADFANNAVKEIPPTCVTSTCVKTLGGGFSFPSGVAVDGSGNVFVADTGNNAAKEMPSGCVAASCVSTLPGDYNDATGVAVDNSGNVFVADHFNEVVKEIPFGCTSDTCVNVAALVNYPYGVAVDGDGQLVVADETLGEVLRLEIASVVDFWTVAIGQTSAAIPLEFIFDSSGVLGSFAALTEGATGQDFAVSGGSCAAATTYATSYSCTINVTFAPKFAGLRKGAVVLKDSLGNTFATAYLRGTGTGPQVSFLPASQSTPGGGFNVPAGVAVDGSGNVFVADTDNNAVKKIPPGCVTSSCVSKLAPTYTLKGGFEFPFGVAIDGSGNVFVADTFHNAVKEILAAGGYVTVNSLGGGFDAPTGVAVDGRGNVFVADTGGGKVYEIPPGCVSGTCTIELAQTYATGGGFSSPYGIAVDGKGNVFVTDVTKVQEIVAAGGYTTVNELAQTYTSGVGFASLTGIAVDGLGNVFVADNNASAVYEILAAGGYTTVHKLNSSLNDAFGVAVDGRGNVYVGNYNNASVVKLDYADAPSLSFATPTPVGSTDTTDGPQTVTVQNIGNATLTFQPFAAGNLLDAVLASGGTSCTALSGLQLAAGATCTLGVEFEPAAAGLVHGHVNVVDNTLNAPSPTYATQTVALQGTGDAAATMTSPTPGSTLGTTNVTFTWGGGAGVTAYELILGTTGFGSHDLYNSGLITATTATVSSIPANLKTVYARLCSEISGVLSCNNYTYTEAGTPTLATMISPISGSTLGTTNVKFTWGGEAGVTAYELILGTTGFGSHDLYNSGLITATTATVSSIPANLATVYARLCSKISGVLSCNNYSYTEAGTPIPATMTSPTGGSTLGTTNVKFTWTSGAGATAYELILGTTGFGSHDLYNSGLITATTATISSLPANAVTVYARLCSKISGVLSCNNYTYTEQ